MKTILIEDPQSLHELCQQLITEPLLAIDTEFFRETTYYPHLGLIQIAGPDHIACVDPLAFDARDELRRLFFNPNIIKVFHSCSQDMEVLYQYFGELPTPIFDTQIAAAMLGSQDQIGYANLVAEQFDVALDKSQTRTNWLKRPLSAKQIEYAGDDVRYLLPLYERFNLALQEKNREAWSQEDCIQLCGNSERFEPDLDNCWLRVKGYFRLSDRQLAVCRSVARWRELQAVEKDLTRRRIMSDELIVKIAATQVDTSNLSGLDNYIARLGRVELETLTRAIETGLQTPESEWPVINRQKPSAEEKQQLSHLLALVQHEADAFNIHPSVLCARKEVEKLMHGARQGRLFTGWRFDIIGKRLLAEVEQTAGATPA